MSQVPEGQSSSEVAHEAETVRAELAHTLDQLRDNLKPEHVIEEVVGNARAGVSTLADGLYALARENPIPALLIGAGCALVLGVGSQIGQRHRPSFELRSSNRNASRIGRLGRLLEVREPTVRDTSWTPYRRLDNRPLNTFAALNSPQDAMTRSTGYARSKSSSAMTLNEMLHEQPLILAALGVAVGAAIGAALPTTDVEDDWMGSTSSSVRHAAQEVAQTEIDELKGVASRTAGNLKQSAADHGLSADNLTGFVKDAGDHAKSALHGVGGSVDPKRPA